VDGGLLLIRRAVEPHRGKLALPGGYIDLGETWQQAGAREVCEETGLTINPDELAVFDVHSAPDSTLLVFGLAQPRTTTDLPPFVPTSESSERVTLTQPETLAFPLHTEAMQRFFDREQPPRTYFVRVFDNFHRTDPDEQFEVEGFPTLAAARAYALARVRSSVEGLRKPGLSKDALYKAWKALGEEAMVEGGEYIGLAHFDTFWRNPATEAETNYLALDPRRRKQ
jgi:ADP-ribose pyrophosphatase YjhB (NUDIX family)